MYRFVYDYLDVQYGKNYKLNYTDTDSIQIHHKNLANLTLNKEIGGISDDLGENCKILYGGWIAPKLYFLEYVEKKNGKEDKVSMECWLL